MGTPSVARDNKAIGENNKYFLSIYLFFFLTFFLYFLLAYRFYQLCLTYILYIYIYISIQCHSRGPRGLKWRPERWQGPFQPHKWTIGPLA